MTKRFIQERKPPYKLVPIDDASFPREAVAHDAPLVMPDIAPYRSMIDGSLITSRSRHREHLRAHGCIEVGNETQERRIPAKPPVTEELIKTLSTMGIL